MRSDTPRFPIVLAAFVGGLALFVAGFFIAAEMRSAVASPAAAGTGGACYTNWNADTCAAGYTAVSTGVWAGVIHGDTHYSTLICAEEKPGTVANDVVFRVAPQATTTP
jgi:ABC-type Fe3+-siderophore transport system permease subunit